MLKCLKWFRFDLDPFAEMDFGDEMDSIAGDFDVAFAHQPHSTNLLGNFGTSKMI